MKRIILFRRIQARGLQLVISSDSAQIRMSYIPILNYIRSIQILSRSKLKLYQYFLIKKNDNIRKNCLQLKYANIKVLKSHMPWSHDEGSQNDI